MRAFVVLGLLLLTLGAVAAGCGGGGNGEAAGADTTTTTTTEATEEPVDETAPGGSSTILCQEITSTSSELNIAATNGDFATVARRWGELRPELPDELRPHVDTVVEGYTKVAADPTQYSILEAAPYKDALDAIHAHTGSTCT